jgi:hypothetical protein
MAFLVVSSFVFLNGYYTISQYSEPQRQPTRDLFRFLQGKAKIGDVVIYQAVQNAGLEPYFVSLRYNYNRFQLYIWRDNPLPFYYGKQIFTPGRNLTTLQSFSSLSKIWVVSPHFSNILNSDGLPVQPNKWSHKIEYHSIIPEDLWKELAQYRFRLETKVCFGNLHLYEFIKRNQE